MELPGAHRYEDYVSAQCPFHDDQRNSLMVYADGFRCLGCDKRGALGTLWRKAKLSNAVPERMVKAEYYPHTSGWSGDQIARMGYKFLRDNPAYQDYLEERGVLGGRVRFGLGYYESWYTIPVFNREQKTIDVVFRACPWIQEQTGMRFYQIPGQKPTLYVPYIREVEKADTIYVTFGLFDAITLTLLGFPAVSSTGGKGVFNPEWLDFHRGKIYIVPDKEEEQEARQLAARLDWRGRVLLLSYPGGTKDPNDYLHKLHDPDELRKDLQCLTH